MDFFFFNNMGSFAEKKGIPRFTDLRFESSIRSMDHSKMEFLESYLQVKRGECMILYLKKTKVQKVIIADKGKENNHNNVSNPSHD
jgi:hypothetical protein